MSKQLLCQKYILKLNSSRLRKARWKLSLPLHEAMKNKNDLVALGSSQVLRFLDELHGRNTEEEAMRLKKKISMLHKATPTARTKKMLEGLYRQLYELQFQPDYVAVIMDKLSDYDRLNKGFSINGIHYKRFLGTNGGVKNSTILYLNRDLYPLIKERLDCGRDKSKPIVPNKLEAYQALICSASTPVSMPHGIIVVPDCVTQFHEDVISIDDSETREPVVSYVKDKLIELTESDGYGLMLPSLARRWNAELGGDPNEALSGVNLRGLPWTKGMAFPFDFIDFGGKVANENYMIMDAWGDWRDIREAELILTTSMLKLWDSYTCWEDYWENVQRYGYQMAIAKTAPHQLENERNTNYQFLQNYNLTDEEIRELVQPTIREIKDAMGMDWRKSILFLRGKEMSEEKIRQDNTTDFAKALMVEPSLINDPFVRGKIYGMIKKKIRQAKIGVLNLKGNFAIIGGDPYSLCQSIYGLPVTGLLKVGETYHHYWTEQGVEEIVCFRAPMTSKYNIRKMRVVATTEMEYWYRDIKTCMLLNSWDSTAEALNGSDKDGDMYYTTNNPVLLRNTTNLPAIFCIQRKAEKKIPTEEDLILANKNSFGDAIGSTTNVITSEICVQARFPEGSKEYEVLDYRIVCGQHYQQTAIDKTKGIIAKPMPKTWYDNRENKIFPEDTEDEIAEKMFNQIIVADKKPYFFIYNYPSLRHEYLEYIKNCETSCIYEFGIGLEELEKREPETEHEDNFLYYYHKNFPVNNAPCTINRICWEIEKAFGNIKTTFPDFDPGILKSDTPYSQKDYVQLEMVYTEYLRRQHEYTRMDKADSYKSPEFQSARPNFLEYFISECYSKVPNEDSVCNILVDLCYSNSKSKQMVWDVCGGKIIQNLLEKNSWNINVPVRDNRGELQFGGDLFTMKTVNLEVTEDGNNHE